MKRSRLLRCLPLALAAAAIVQLSEGRVVAGQAFKAGCRAGTSLNTYASKMLTFQVPAGWKMRNLPDGRLLFVGDSEDCVLSVAHADGLGSGVIDATAVFMRRILAQYPNASIVSMPTLVTVGAGLQATSTVWINSAPGETPFVSQVIGIDTGGGLLTFQLSYTENDAAAAQALFSRVLKTVTLPYRTPSAVASTKTAPIPSPAPTVDMANAAHYQNSNFGFDYPRGWTIRSDNTDPEDADYWLVRLLPPDGVDMLQVRYKRLAPRQAIGSSVGWAGSLAANAVASFLKGHEDDLAGGPAGKMLARYYVHADTKPLDVVVASLPSEPDFASIAYSYDNRQIRPRTLADLPVLALAVQSFTFTGSPKLTNRSGDDRPSSPPPNPSSSADVPDWAKGMIGVLSNSAVDNPKPGQMPRP